jgi:hypothetical protein
VINEIGNTGWQGKIMGQANHVFAMVLHSFAYVCQRNGIVSVEKQFNIRTRQLLSNRPTNSAACTRD